ncbi:MAG: cupin domain-containing protein [Pseudomonadota bacterium]
MQSEDWGTMEWLVEDATHPGANMSFARMTVRPGKISPAHRHANSNEVIHVLSGQMEERLGETWKKAQAGDSVFVSKGTVHQTKCVGEEEVVMVVAYSEGQRAYENMEQNQ